MTLTEILQSWDYAEIFSKWLRKRLPDEYSVQHQHGIGEQSKNIYVTKEIHGGDDLDFIIQVQRLGKTFLVQTICDVEEENEFKTIDQVLAHIEDVGSRPEEWAEDRRGLNLE